MNKATLIITGILGALAVTLGAFGAHGLKPLLTIEQMHTFETANRYHFYHTLAILLTVLLSRQSSAGNSYCTTLFLFIIGIILFSGSLYLSACKSVLEIGWSFLGPLTPIGGLFLIIGWISLAINGYKKPRSPAS